MKRRLALGTGAPDAGDESGAVAWSLVDAAIATRPRLAHSTSGFRMRGGSLCDAVMIATGEMGESLNDASG